MSVTGPILRPVIEPVIRSVFDVEAGIGEFLANLLTEEGERITTEESAYIKQEPSNG